MLKVVQHKLAGKRAQAGFTIIELLAALAILAVLGTMVASAMVTGSRIMATSTATANASVLEQSIQTALSDTLRYASAHVPAGASSAENPSFDSDSFLDYAGSAVRDGRLGVEEGRIALNTASGIQYVPKAAGIYTDFMVSDFQLNYDCATNVFSATYTISLPDGSYSRTGECVCKSLVEETYE